MTLTRTLIIAVSLFSLITLNAYADSHGLDSAIKGEHRSAANKARDVYRHPKGTLQFFGIHSSMQVLEILPGRGWYTEILAPYLAGEGHLTVASFGENHKTEYLANLHKGFVKMMAAKPDVYNKVDVVVFKEDSYLKAVPDASMDMVVTFRNTHNWIRYGGIEDIYAAFHRVLKPGGVLGVVQHRANKGSDPKESAEKGYVPKSYLIRLIENSGFELVGSSEINANPKDTKDHPEGVWTLPPSYRLKDVDKEKYTAIGESDRMTFRFIKQ
jgi:predicted methyltransferase